MKLKITHSINWIHVSLNNKIQIPIRKIEKSGDKEMGRQAKGFFSTNFAEEMSFWDSRKYDTTWASNFVIISVELGHNDYADHLFHTQADMVAYLMPTKCSTLDLHDTSSMNLT